MKQPPLKNRLRRSFYARSTDLVARELLGKALLRRIASDDGGGVWVGGMIVETEAYLPMNDPACHAARGKTSSNAQMFARPGTLYVYPIHANHCMNTVTEREGIGFCAALIRAIEPLWGIDLMKANRGLDNLLRLMRGPGMSCQALQVDRSCDGIDLASDESMVIASLVSPRDIDCVTTSRIGISQGTELKLRFAVRDNRFVSGPKRLELGSN